jgi:hypothetical protein
MKYTEHLQRAHGLVTAEGRKPHMPKVEKVLHFPQVSCPVGGFGKKCQQTFKQRTTLEKHLTSALHSMSDEDAKKKADEVASSLYVLVLDFEKTGAGQSDAPGHDAPIEEDEYEEDGGLFL